MSNLSIRYACLADLEEISQIESLNFSEQEAISSESFAEWLTSFPATFLLAEIKGEIAAYLVGTALFTDDVTDKSLQKVQPNPEKSGFIALQRLSVHPDFQGQGVGSLLLATMKEVALAQKGQGISLVCQDQFISYFEMNGFTDEGMAQSPASGSPCFHLVWENPYYEEEA